MKEGCSRIVLLIGRWAVKFPNARIHHLHFLHGCYGNWSERQCWIRMRRNIAMNPHRADAIKANMEMLAPSLFCSWFGLIQVMKRAAPLERDLTEKEASEFAWATTDTKKENFGIINGKVVCVDYA